MGQCEPLWGEGVYIQVWMLGLKGILCVPEACVHTACRSIHMWDREAPGRTPGLNSIFPVSIFRTC